MIVDFADINLPTRIEGAIRADKAERRTTFRVE
jgi:hypothetical protein